MNSINLKNPEQLSTHFIEKYILYFIIFTLFIFPSLTYSQGDWNFAGHDRNNSRYNDQERIISPENVHNLVVKWALETGSDISATPAVDKQAIYFPDWGGNLHKVDRHTGAIIWSVSVGDLIGVNFSWSRITPTLKGDKVIIGTQSDDDFSGTHLIAVYKSNGQTIWTSLVDNHFASVITSSPMIHGDEIYVGISSLEEALAAFIPGYQCCTFRGSVVKVNLNDGSIIWKTYMAPDLSTGFSGNAVWGSTPVVDPKRNSVYVTTGNNYSVPQEIENCIYDEFGELRPPNELYDCVSGVPGSAENLFDAIVSLDMTTGAIKWSTSALPVDAWTVSCLLPFEPFNPDNCPETQSPDYDFGQGPMLFKTPQKLELLGAGQKSGKFWALNPDNGNVQWVTQVGPGGVTGGLQWGSASDGQRIYTANSNSGYAPEVLLGGQSNMGGKWSALDAQTGEVLWETAINQPPAFGPYPEGAVAMNQGAVSGANGVIFGGATNATGTMVAMDASNGNVLWSFESGATVNSGAAISDGDVFWGNGYVNFGIGTGSGGGTAGPGNGGSSRMYCFGLGGESSDRNSPIEIVSDQVQLKSFPNPFIESTEITYTIGKDQFVEISIYNLAGNKIKTLVNENQAKGNHSVIFISSQLPEGIYIARMITEEKSYGIQLIHH